MPGTASARSLVNRSRRLWAAGVGLAVLWIVADPQAVPQAARSRTVYVTATDSKGARVDDLTAADVTVKEAGKDATVLAIGPAEKAMTIIALVSDEGSGVFRIPLARFIQRLQTKAQFALNSVVAQSLRVVDFTSAGGPLAAGLDRLGPRERTPSGQLLEAISSAAIEFQKREDARPVILVLSVGGVEHTSLSSDRVLDELRKSRAVMSVISVHGNAMRTAPSGQDAPAATDNISQQRAALAASEQFDGATDLNNVLDRGPSQSGGRRQEVITVTALIAALQQAAEELAGQYQVTYESPADTKPGDRLAVSTKRKGIVLRAPTRLPN
jgi:hypothetical protein